MVFIGKFLRGVAALSEWTGKLVSYLILILAVMVGIEVVSRYVFNHPTLWAHELSAMLFGTFIILGGAYAGVKGLQVNMDVIYNTLQPRVRALLDVLTFSVALAFVGVLVWKGGQSAWKSVRVLEHASTQWAPPIYPFKLMLPLGAFMVLLQLTAKFIRDLAVLILGEEPAAWK